MEVTIFSRETIKPSISPPHIPQNLCLFDQLTPNIYPEVLLFYPTNINHNFNITKTLTNLKKSLSQTLTIFYPFSGRTKRNLYIDEFDTGVPFAEARVNLTMSDYFLRLNKDTESLAKFVPSFGHRVDSPPLIAFQVNVFSCGGLALGTSVCHKKSDGATLSHFLQTWASIHSKKGVTIAPNHSEAASLFPPMPELPENALSLLMDELWFKKRRFVTRTFSFSTEAVETLRSHAKTEKVPSPSRNEAVCCFIWKHAMSASRRVSGSPRTSLAVHAVNMRPRMKSSNRETLECCTGNLFWWAPVLSTAATAELRDLVASTREIMDELNGDYFDAMVGPAGFEKIAEFLFQFGAMMSMESEKPEIYGFSNWKGFFNEVDFGWGNPVRVASNGRVGNFFRNLVVLIDKQKQGHSTDNDDDYKDKDNKEIEVFLSLDEKQMAVLEKDEEFLAFAGFPVERSNNIVSHGLINSKL